MPDTINPAERLGDTAERDLITLYLDEAGTWRWKWQAPNGRTVGASTEGYTSRLDLVRNLERLAGGTVVITYRMRTPHASGGTYQQGHLSRLMPGHAEVEYSRVELRVL